jgi:hypothetical protein
MSDFTWTPDYVLTPGSQFKTEVSEAENGTKQYRSLWPSGQGFWRLIFKERTLAVAQAVKAFFDLKLGRATAFTWTCPLDSVEYTVRFRQDNFQFDSVEYDKAEFQIEFEEDI